MGDDFMKVEEYPGKVRDEESDDDGDKDHRHFVLGPPPFHIRGLLKREGCCSVFAGGETTTITINELKQVTYVEPSDSPLHAVKLSLTAGSGLALGYDLRVTVSYFWQK